MLLIWACHSKNLKKKKKKKKKLRFFLPCTDDGKEKHVTSGMDINRGPVARGP